MTEKKRGGTKVPKKLYVIMKNGSSKIADYDISGIPTFYKTKKEAENWLYDEEVERVVKVELTYWELTK